ncbi:MAG: hypothetical protein WD749_10130 [Phycisphaerales bacterium]
MTLPDAPNAANAAEPGQGRLSARRLLWVVAFAAVLPLVALWVASARGPFYLEINTDPEYAYLLNSLLVAEGSAPCHMDHPGTPVQVVGAGAIRALHLVRGGPLRDDVLLHPEVYLRAIRVAVVGLAAALSAIGGALAVRATGRLSAGAMVQLGPLCCGMGAVMADRAQPEPLLTGLGIALAGLALGAIHRGSPARRDAVAAGVLVGAGTACKVLFAPAALVALGALAGWRARGLFLVSATGAFIVATFPILGGLPALAGWLGGIMTRSGPYGRGEPEWISASSYIRNLSDLAAREPLYVGIALGGLIVAGAHLLLRRGPSGREAQHRRTLALTAGAQVVLLAVVAKHPSARYLIAGASLSGLTLALTGALLPVPGARRARVAATAAALGAALAGASWQGWKLGHWRARAAVLSDRERPVAEFLGTAEGASVIHGARISSPASALQFGNSFACGRFGADLARLYPGTLIWDAEGVHRFGAPPALGGPGPPARGEPFRAVVSPRYSTHRAPGAGELDITTERVFGRDRLILAALRPASRGAPDFSGYEEVSGLDRLEGPFPHPPAPAQAETVRWGLGPATRARFTGTGEPLRLVFEGRPINRRGQAVEVVIDGTTVARHEFGFPARFERRVIGPLPVAPGVHTLELRYALSDRTDGRPLAVLYRTLQIIPGAGGTE